MAEIIDFSDGGYRFMRGVFPYSAGVAALPGMTIERVRFRRMLPMADGFAAIAAHLQQRGPAADGAVRLRTALAGTLQRRGFRGLQRRVRRRR